MSVTGCKICDLYYVESNNKIQQFLGKVRDIDLNTCDTLITHEALQFYKDDCLPLNRKRGQRDQLQQISPQEVINHLINHDKTVNRGLKLQLDHTFTMFNKVKTRYDEVDNDAQMEEDEKDSRTSNLTEQMFKIVRMQREVISLLGKQKNVIY